MKVLNYLVALLAAVIFTIFSSNWVFNHINPWLGILIAVVGLYLMVFSLIKLYKKGENNEEN